MTCPRCSTPLRGGDRFCPECAEPVGLAPGMLLADRYRVEGHIGSGGMSQVYRARHIGLDRAVAVKLLGRGASGKVLARFRREALAVSRLNHPHVAAAIEFNTHEGRPFLVMELVDGRSLEQIISDEGALEPRRAVRLARQVALGLGAAHAAGVIHRDVKPANVLVATVDGEELVKVVDFGLAVLAEARGANPITEAGITMGTPAYLSPEQLVGDPVGPSADVYGLGITLFELLTGEPPFDGSTLTIVNRHLKETPPPPSTRRPGFIPQALDALVLAMLDKRPGNRPTDGTAAAAALEALLR